jgi:hypothetical protein
MMFVRRSCIAALVVFAGVGTLSAQTVQPRLDVGAQISTLRFGDADASNVAVGARATFDLTRWFAIDAAVNFAPRDNVTSNSALSAGTLGLVYRRSRIDALAGVKIGYRGQRVGIFAKVRPGITRLTDKGVECKGDVCALVLLVVPEYRTELAVDYGAVVEFYPSSRVVARFDVGDMVVRHRAAQAPPFTVGASHNLSSGVGIGFAF